MVLHFNVVGEKRKQMVEEIEKVLGVKAKYCGVPSCSYQIKGYNVGKNGELTMSDNESVDEMSKVINACVKITGSSPSELAVTNETEKPEEIPVVEDVGLTISLPIQKANTEKLKAILDSKSCLIKKALGIDDLDFEFDEAEVSFPWFSSRLDSETVETYTRFLSALCEMSIKQSRVQAKEREADNEKYTFRCFLLRLGFIGEKFKKDRRILLKNLVGSASYKSKAKGCEE